MALSNIHKSACNLFRTFRALCWTDSHRHRALFFVFCLFVLFFFFKKKNDPITENEKIQVKAIVCLEWQHLNVCEFKSQVILVMAGQTVPRLTAIDAVCVHGQFPKAGEYSLIYNSPCIRGAWNFEDKIRNDKHSVFCMTAASRWLCKHL